MLYEEENTFILYFECLVYKKHSCLYSILYFRVKI